MPGRGAEHPCEDGTCQRRPRRAKALSCQEIASEHCDSGACFGERKTLIAESPCVPKASPWHGFLVTREVYVGLSMIQTIGELLARIFDGRTCGHMSHSTRAWDHLGPSVDTFIDIECTWSATPCALGCRSGRLAKGEAWNLGSCVFDRGGSECRSGRIGTRRGPIALHGRRAVHPAGPGFDP